MSALLTLWFKGVLLMAVGLAASHLPGLTASARHFTLALTFVAMALLPLSFLVSAMPISVATPDGLESWLPAFDKLGQIDLQTTTSDSSAVFTLTPGGVCIAFVLVTLLLLAYWSIQLFRTQRWINATSVLPTTLLASMTVWPRTGTRTVTVRQSTSTGSPLTWGVFRPCIVVPADWQSWPPDKQRSSLVHELAHISRFDTLTASVGLVICFVFWANPLVWIAHFRLRETAEHAADDAVVGSGTAPTDYASQLLRMARARNPDSTTAMASGSHLYRRVKALLDEHTRRMPMKTIHYLLITVALASVLVPIGAIRAELSVSVPTEANRDVPPLSEATYDGLAAAQGLIEEGQPNEAISLLETLRDGGNLNGYEMAQAWNMLAFAYFEANDVPKTIDAYEHVLGDRDAITQGLEESTLRALMQLYFGNEDYSASIRRLDEYMALRGRDPKTLFIRATALYQSKQFEAALVSAREVETLAQDLGSPVEENWLYLQVVLNNELGRPDQMVTVMERMMALYPNEETGRHLTKLKAWLETSEGPYPL